MTATADGILVAPGWSSAGGELGLMVDGRLSDVPVLDVVELRDGLALTHREVYDVDGMEQVATSGASDPVASLWRRAATGAEAWWDQAGNPGRQLLPPPRR